MSDIQKPHLLVVDDDEDIILLFESHFQRRRPNFTYSHVSNGHDAVDYVLRSGKFTDPVRHPVCSVVLLDINIPGINGFEVLETIKNDSRHRDLPVIASFTTSNFLQDRQKATTLGAFKHIQKIDNFYNLFPEIDLMLNEAAKHQAAK